MARPQYSASSTISLRPSVARPRTSSLTLGESPIFRISPGWFRSSLDDPIAASLSSPIFYVC
ncbi:hypothetical protein ACLOJK_024957 [Asimina triloba]